MSVLRKPEVCFRTALLMALGLLSSAAALAVECTLEQGSMIRRMDVPAGETSLAGQWATLGVFRVRTALTTPRQGRAWLLIEVYAEAGRQDFRILSSHTVESPFDTGRVDVVAPRLGQSLTYTCKDDHP
ncbi:MAG TPA: hypothetical protein PKE01_12670 [Rhodocyclaceae bacterium]|nr:hypothetical protein [Rhodocyclaceae bacterium]HMW53291.1 hypothetical protein [Rhodocyclaceae bacterium]HNB65395.1 hypothetical protein [Rhodocyclaceae bacterium]HNC79901.1 hypothetical protein [Rhodocyclaceae bacterium]